MLRTPGVEASIRSAPRAPGEPFQFAAPFVVKVTPATHGQWETTADGQTRVWRWRVTSAGAISLNLGFTRYRMPEGGRLLVYTPDYTEVIGPFTDTDNEAHGELWTPILTGDEVVIEVAVPAGQVEEVELELGSVNRGYQDVALAIRGVRSHWSCNIDVVCSEADAYRDQVRSVGLIVIDGRSSCSGAMLSNTARDGKPYFLTAQHCFPMSEDDPEHVASSAVVYWNYESPTCGSQSDGSLAQYQIGASLRAHHQATDFALLELDDRPDPTHKVYYAGWDRSEAKVTSAVGIHHPRGHVKSIGFENSTVTVTSQGQTSVPGDRSHLRVDRWERGTSELGSSGSPLFNQNKRVVGQLSLTSTTRCVLGSEWYGRVATSWTGGETRDSRLSDWLDPDGTGGTTIDGHDTRVAGVAGMLRGLALLTTDAAERVEVAGAFQSPINTPLTYTAHSSDPTVATVSETDGTLTVTPVAEGVALVSVTAQGASLLPATQWFTVTVWPESGVDYDQDDDGLIDIRTVAQLDATRHDRDGDGVPTEDNATVYTNAFPGMETLVCGGDAGCGGYELMTDLDFDTNGNGRIDEHDLFWNAGAGWKPIQGFRTMLEGNGHVIRYLYIDSAHGEPSAYGLFARLASAATVRNLDLTDVNVKGRLNVAGLAGRNTGTITECSVTGRAEASNSHVGGLVGLNEEGGTISASSAAVRVISEGTIAGGLVGRNRPGGSITAGHATGEVSANATAGVVGGLVGINEGSITTSYATGATDSSNDGGGLVGINAGSITTSYATGRVAGDTRFFGGLVGINAGSITTSYATGRVAGHTGAGGLVGINAGSITTSYATGRVAGSRSTGGLVGRNDSGTIRASYATGLVRGTQNVGGLVGINAGTITASYWDTQTSDRTSGTHGRTTGQLQTPTDYSDLYANWSLDLDDDSMGDDPWDFGTSRQYPALQVNFDGQGAVSWQEFGHQLRDSPTLTADTATMGQVDLDWDTVTNHWGSAATVTYTVTRGDTALAEGLSTTDYIDTTVTAGNDYTYQVTAIVDGGAATRSARLKVTAAANQKPAFDEGSSTMRSVDEHTVVGAAIGDPVEATDTDDTSLTYSLSGTDATSFTINTSTGQLRTNIALNYEIKTRYTVTVAVRDSKNADGEADMATDDTITVTINVVNVNEAGLVSLTGTPPQELQQLTAALSDLDGGLRDISWQWARSPNQSTWTAISGATSARYTPGTADVNQYLRATATYTDGQGSGKRAAAVTARVQAAAVTVPAQAAPEVTLHLSDTSISEAGTERSTVTATLDPASSAVTTVTVSAPPSDVVLSSNRTLRIEIGDRASTGHTVTLTAKPNTVDGPERKTVQVSGKTSNRLVTEPDPVNLTIEDDDAAPTVMLVLSPQQIAENDKMSTVTATLSHPSSEATTVVVSAVAVSPAVAGDFTLSMNTTLTIRAGDTASRGTAVTLTSVDNDTDAPNKQVTVSGTARNTQGIAGNPADATLSITDDEGPPTVTLTLSDTQIDEDGGQSTLTVKLSHPSSKDTTVTVTADPADAVTLSPNPLTIRAEDTVGTVTLTAENNEVDGPERKTVTISADAENDLGVTDPPSTTLTIEDDDNPPVVTLVLSERKLSSDSIDESGVDNNVTVTATLDRASSEQIVVTVATASEYTLSNPSTLTIPAGETESTGTPVTLTAKDNDIDADDAEIMVGGTASKGLDVTAAELTITDDDTRGVTVSPTELTVIEGSSDTFTYTVVLDSEPTAPVTVTVEKTTGSDADVRVSPSSLIFRANTWDDEQPVRVSVQDDPDADDDTARITHTVSGGDYEGEAADAVAVTVEDDEAEATAVTLSVNRDVPESSTGTVVTVTGTLNGAPKQYETVVRVTVTADTAVDNDFNAVSPFDLTIAPGQERGTADFTLTPVNDLMDEPDEETVAVGGSATVRDGATIVERLDVNGTTVTITDNDNPPTVTLEVTDNAIGEGETSQVTATLDHPSSEDTEVAVSATAVSPAVDDDFTLSGTSLTIRAGQTASSGSVTLTAQNNPEDEADKAVTVTGRATNTLGVQATTVGPVTVTITDDDPPEVAGDDIPAYREGGTGPVATYTATDPANVGLEWSMTEPDARFFTISNGVLRFQTPPDYEDPNNTDQAYAVTVHASDGTFTGELAVFVKVEDALGTVRLPPLQPQVGGEITATVSDPDEVSTVTEWCWKRSLFAAFPPADTHEIHCIFANLTTTAGYTPVEADLGHYLRATVRYTDGQGTAKTAPAAGGTTETVSAQRRPPPPPPGPGPGPGPGGGGGGGGPACTEDLHGNSATQSTDIALSAVTAGVICPAVDVDYLIVTAPGRGLLFVDTTGSVPIRGTIWQDGMVMATGPAGRSQAARLGARVQAGPVVVAVQGQSGATGAYEVEITFVQGYLENPGSDSFQSGVGVLSGWVCDAEVVEGALNGVLQEAAYGTERLDTQAVCGDVDNGFGLLVNWNRLGAGEHTVVASVDGVALGRATVTVTTLGAEFLRGAAGTCAAEDFPRLGERVTLVWQQPSQNFVIAGGDAPVGVNRAGVAGVGYLENPGPDSFQSGVGVISGWVCAAALVEVALNGVLQEAAYGTERLDTQAVCGDVDNGFGLLVNWNRLGEGEHTVVAYVDDVELGRATVRVTTVGAGAEEEFLRGAEGACVVEDFPRLGRSVLLEWQQNSQNFVITDVE